MTEICEECYVATKRVIAEDPGILRGAIEAAIEEGAFDEAVLRRASILRRS